MAPTSPRFNVRSLSLWLLMGLLVFAGGCGDDTESTTELPEGASEGDLGIGEVDNPKADGFFGYATTCKELPQVEPLADPMIVVSLDGLTLHLFDRAGDYDRVFPVGVGGIENGVSLTPVSTNLPTGSYYTRTDEPPVDDGATPQQARWGWNQRCRVWWKSTDTGEQLPVFAGLPFIRLAGHPTSSSYALHGPVDNYTIASGGTLRRGYVSHGCVRMAAADIAEVWGRIQGRRAEVRIQKAVERREDAVAVDYDPWMLSECTQDADCAYSGGICKQNPYSGRGFCTRRCTRGCPDRSGHPTTFCAPDPDEAGAGFCTYKAEASTNGCRRLPGFVKATGVPRPDGSSRADVCLPGSQGWIGDRCLSDDECDSGHCTPLAGGPEGICAEPCSRYCPDKVGGYASTFCAPAPESVPDEGGMCVARCFSNDDCVVGTSCVQTGRFGQTSVVRASCVPD